MANIARALLTLVFLVNQIIPGNLIPKIQVLSHPLQETQDATPNSNGYPPPVEATPTPDSTLIPTSTSTQEFTSSVTPVPTDALVPTDSPTAQPTEIAGDNGGDPTHPDAVLTLAAEEEFYVPGNTIILDWKLQPTDLISEPTLKIFYSKNITFQGDISECSTESMSDESQGGDQDNTCFIMVDIAEKSGSLIFQTAADLKQSLYFRAVLYDGEKTEYSADIKLHAAQVFHTVDKKFNSVTKEGRINLKIPEGALSSDAIFYAYSTDMEDIPYSLSGNPITIIARQDETRAPVEHFDQPITIEFQYSDLAYSLGDEENLSLFYFSEEENTWIPVPSLVDTKNNVVTGYSDHLSFYDIDVNKWEAARLPSMEGFQTSLFTGAATYSYPFEVPAGPGGLQPDLNLSYNSQVVDSALSRMQASWVGMGWSLDTGYIERNIHDTQDRMISEGHSSTYDPTSDDTFSIVVNGVSDTLLPIPESEGDGDPTTIDYRTTNDSFWRIRRYNLTACIGYSSDGNFTQVTKDCSYWMAWDKSGNQYYFGSNVAGDGGTSYYMEWHKGWEGGDYPDGDWGALRPWRWSLTAVTNTSNKTLTYSYTNIVKTVDYSSLSPSYSVDAAVYPKEIVYPHGNYRVYFALSDRTDYDTAWNNINANIRYTTKKLSAIIVEQYNGSTWVLVRKYLLNYYTNTENSVFPGLTWSAGGKTLTLKSITEVGTNGTSTLPETTFSYEDNMHLTSATNGYGGKVVYDYEDEPWYSQDAPEDWKVEGRFDDDVVNNIDGVCGNNIPQKISGNDLGWEAVDSTDFVSCITSDYGYVTLRGHTYNDSIAENFQPGGWYRFRLYLAGAGQNLTLWINGGIPQGTSTTLLSGWNYYSYEGYLPGNIGSVRLIANCLTANEAQGNCGIKRHSFTLLPTRYRVEAKKLYASPMDANPIQTVTYQYFGAAMNDAATSAAASQPKETRYNDPYTEFRGHERVVETYSNGQVVTTYFHQDDILKGRVSRVTVANAADKIFSENINTYTSTPYSLATGAAYFPKNASGTAYTDLLGYRVFTASEVIRNYNGDVAVPAGIDDDPALTWTGQRTEYHYQPDQQCAKQYGDLTQTVQSYWTGSVWQDYRLTWSEYYPRDEQTGEARYIVGLPAYTNVYSCPASSQNGDCYDDLDPIPLDDSRLSSTSYIYDSLSPTTTVNQQPTQGLLTQVRKLIANEPTDQYQDTFTVYDEWAMPTSVTTYTGYGTPTAVASDGPQTTTTTYDPVYHTYPVTTTHIVPGGSPVERTTTVTYHPLLGLPTSETDPNGSVTSAEYDVFGRMTKLIRPGDTTSSPSLSFSYHAETVPFWTELKQKIDGTNSQTARKFYDGLGNLVQEQTAGVEFADNYCSSDADLLPDVCDIVIDHEYGDNGNGSFTRTAVSKAVPQGAGWQALSHTANDWTTVQADILGRTLLMAQPDGASTQNAYAIQDFSILGAPQRVLDTLTMDALGHVTHTYTDSRGRTVQVSAPDGPFIVYRYDELDRLKEVDQVNRNTDAVFATTTLTLDLAGRKTSMTDPDMGYWSYSYDALGNLASQTDAEGHKIWMEYDSLNRLLVKGTYTDEEEPVAYPLATYSYDQSSETSLGVGQRTGMTDASGSTAWEYDARGRVIHESKHVLDGVNDLGEYNTYWTYYSNDSVHQMVYPNQEAVTFAYNANGLLERVSSIQDSTYDYHDYVSGIQYDESGRVVRRELGNGVAQSYTFNLWTIQGGRLSNLTTTGAQTYQNLSYTYDDNGNIKSITDAVANETLNFTYDSLNRLDTAGGPYSEDPAYDAVTGNIASRNSIIYSYDPDHVHAVAATTNGNSYTYDNNGNMFTRSVSGESYGLTYDKENRLTNITGNGSNARYVYDGDGNRVIAVEDGITTVYIGNYFEAELGTETTYPVFVPDLVQGELPNKLYLPMILNGEGTGSVAPQVGPGFYLTHPIIPNQESITWRMYYYAGAQRVAMRVAEMPIAEPQPTPTPGPTPTVEPYPAPTQSAHQENIFTRFVAFLKDLFEAQPVYAAASKAPAAVIAPIGEVYFLLSDHLGSTTITLNVDGSVKSEIRYDAWGKTRDNSGTTPTERRYTGQIEEAGAGLYFYNTRWYDDSLGRFIQPDSIVPEAIQGTLAWDRYAYSNNNSIRYSDSSGHCIGPLLPLCLMAAAFIADNAAIITSIAISGAILSFVGPSDPDPVLINDPIASQQALDNSALQAYGWLTLGQAALEFSSVANASSTGNTQSPQDNRENSYCRYCSEAELEAINETGYLRGARPGDTYFTTDNYFSAIEAQEKLSLYAPPEIKIDFSITNSPNITGPSVVRPKYGQNGKGIEYWSSDPVQVLIKSILKLQ
ncbi:protein containg RHS repeat-associated core domain [Longilinea arvoryzae]|uniref:Protein containg RHS repeat-associated core domain n=1 Tax=Longilinea arvoryzae TaxID=360412 RepID=A0A0K8MXT2_9CHLR|nr:RHS repeat-associated core domain-containing protein [Longilinea arvoryzae]GAP16064.1 protein containg RHS repeat-associated core domain [Longilinea arvoryzae]